MTLNLTEYRHVIWDWNGTLLDDAWLCVEVVSEISQRRGMPAIDHRRYQEVFDFPIIAYYEKLGFDFTDEPFDTVAVEFVELYYPRVCECRLQPHAVETIEWLQEKMIGQSVLSASNQQALETMVDTFKLKSKFENVLGLDDHHARSKLAVGNQLMQDLDIDKKQVLLIGDTVHDSEVAAEIGVDCILIPGGHHPFEKLQKTGSPVLHSLKDLNLNGKN